MTILHLVHEGNPVELAAKSADFAMPALMRRWQAGENDVTDEPRPPVMAGAGRHGGLARWFMSCAAASPRRRANPIRPPGAR